MARRDPKYKEKEKIVKQQSRQSSTYRERERHTEIELKRKKRQDDLFKRKEKIAKQQSRQSSTYRERERHTEIELKRKKRQDDLFKRKEKIAKQQSRQSLTYRERERHTEVDLKRKKRQDDLFKRKEKIAKQQSRQSLTYRERERHTEVDLKRKKRQDDLFKRKEKIAKQQSRQSLTYRERERHTEVDLKRKKRQDDLFRRKEKIAKQQSRLNLDYRQKQRISDIELKRKKRQDDLFKGKEKILKQQSRLNLDYRQKERISEVDLKRKKRKHEQFREKEKIHKQKSRKSENYKSKERQKQRKRQSRQQQRHCLNDLAQTIKCFHEACREIPVFICTICFRLFFKKQVLKFKKEKYVRVEDIDKYDFVPPSSSTENKWVCFTCHRGLLAGKTPNQALLNKLYLPPLPPPLTGLNQLERHLISPVIPFMKIMPLPKGLQKGIHGPVVCVPSNINQITQVLPRPLDDHSLIKVKFKRKMEYKSFHLYQKVSTTKINDALEYLKDNNPNFQDISIGNTLQPADPDEASILIKQEPQTDGKSTVDLSVCDSDLPTVLNALPADEEPSILPPQSANTEVFPTSTGQNKSSGITSDSSDLHETSSPMVSCLQPNDLSQHVADHGTDLYSLAPAEGNRPCGVFNMEMKAFPYLFPDGKNGFSENRKNKVGYKNYFNSRLFSADQRFAQDAQYIFFAQYVKELDQTTSSISIAIRKGSPSTEITAATLSDPEKRKKLLKSNEGYRFLKSVRGSPPYWEKTLRDLFAMVRQKGTPTWFCSFSAADRRWPEICQAICAQQNKEVPEDLDWMTHCQIINSNPVTACRIFEQRVHNFINKVILSPAQPIGNVTDFFFRTEFQSRGWPHIHCLFWCDDSPTFVQDGDNSAFQAYIDKYVTCKIPKQEDALHEVVTSVQMHSQSHSRSCKKGSKTCRFNFPRPPSLKTFIAQKKPPPENITSEVYFDQAKQVLKTVREVIEKDNESVPTLEEVFKITGVTQTQYQDAHSSLTTRNTIIFKRQPSEAWVNPYSKPLLEAWNGNMDIQPVLDPYSCIKYIVSYISKAEHELGDLLKRAQQEAEQGHVEPVQQLRKLGNIYLNHREISIMEAIYRVTGMKLKQSSREVVFIPTDPQTARLTKPLHILERQSQQDEVWMTGLIDRYLARPASQDFEFMCLAQFCSEYKVVYKKSIQEDQLEKDESSECLPSNTFLLQQGLGKISKRAKSAVVRYTHFNKEKDPERYYCNLLRMYLPHRTTEVKTPHQESYEVAFNASKEIVLTNMTSFEKLSEELDAAWKELQTAQDHSDVWADIAPNMETERVEQEEELERVRRELELTAEEVDIDDIPELSHSTTKQPKKVNTVTSQTSKNEMIFGSEQDHKNRVRSLNSRQADLFFFIGDWGIRKAAGQCVKPFHIFLTGGAGTGKSHVIRCIHHEIQKRLTPHESENPDSPVVLLLAPTGTAAYNISGQTIHSAFCINKTTSKVLAEDQANTLRTRLGDVELVIIDEISMVSAKLLSVIHCRLQQIKQPSSSSSFFGNVSILAVGDFYQLPPVMEKQLFSQTNKLTDLWSLFHQWELTDVVRQQEDAQFANLLNRLRLRDKSQPLDQNDESVLQTRLISRNDPQYPLSSLHLYSTNKQLQAHNQMMLQQTVGAESLITITAVDICTEPKTQKTYKRKEPLNSPNTALLTSFSVCKQARVMLSTNVDVKDGLTNGVLGTVTAIVQGTSPLGQPEGIFVLFDDPRVGTASRKTSATPQGINPNSTFIKPQTQPIQSKPYHVTRHQFPLKLSWAVTIHKVQGLTTDTAVVSLKNIFQPGMAYVALSRLTSLNGLFLIKEDYDPKAIYSNIRIHTSLAAMPQADILPCWNQFVPPSPADYSTRFLLVSHNTDGLLPNMADFRANNFIHKAHVVALQETWLTQKQNLTNPIPTHAVLLSNRENQYSRFENLPQSLKENGKGGVLLFLQNKLSYTALDTSTVPIECIAVEIESPSVTVFNVYRPPKLPLQHFTKYLQLLLSRAKTHSIIVVGDFNVDLLKGQKLSCLSNYDQLITDYTTRGCTLLDHIYTKGVQCNRSGVVQTHYSYHNMTYLII